MKILQTSDTHTGITGVSAIEKMIKRMVHEDFDVFMHNGDYSGGKVGHKHVRLFVELFRKYHPDKPFVSIIGNHDYWAEPNAYKGENRLEAYRNNYESVCQTFSDNGVHFFDRDGIYRHPSFADIVLMGHSGWYNHPAPPTNDQNFLPIGLDGDTNRALLKKANEAWILQADEVEKIYEPHMTVGFVSHFPVVNSVADHKGSFHQFCWDENIQFELIKRFNCKYFFCGHAHKLQQGPLRYESGSDYYNPKYHIVEVT